MQSPQELARTHRFLSNTIVTHADCAEEFAVASYLLVSYAYPEESSMNVFTVNRCDRMRRTSKSFRIVRRDIRMARITADVRDFVGPL